MSLVHCDGRQSIVSSLFIVFNPLHRPKKRSPAHKHAEDPIVQFYLWKNRLPDDAFVFRNDEVICTQKRRRVLSQLH